MYDVLVLSMDINLQRKFVRLSDDDKSATYQVFRKWLGSTSINDENWSEIVDEDEAFDYCNLGVGREDSGSNEGSHEVLPVGAEEEVESEQWDDGNESINDD